MKQDNAGVLYIVATPIGNLGDITVRAIEVLKRVNLIAAEDTRHTRKLLNHYGISNELVSCYEYSDKSKIEYILTRLEEGDDVALVSDAGTPSVSDPGRFLVSIVRQKGISVFGIPGPCAAINAYSVSGFDDKRFVFWGFLPEKTNEIINELYTISEYEYPVIVYVSPHKVLKILKLFDEVFNKLTTLTVLREMTKIHEEYFCGTVADCMNHFIINDPKGEFVFIIKNYIELNETGDDEILELIRLKLKDGLSIKDICRQINKETGIPKNRVYRIAVGQK